MRRPLPPAWAPVRRVRLEQQRAHRGREGQRHDQRDHGRARDGQRELAVELPGNAGDEGGRHEHRAEHQRDRDQRAADLVHALARGIARREPRRDIALDILDHHDRVVDNDPDGEHQAEQRQIVEREAEQAHHEEGADERDRDRQDRDDCRAPSLQEQDYHQYDQHDRLEDGLGDGIDRLADELRRIVADGVFQPLGEVLRQLLHGCNHAVGGRERVRAGKLVDRERDRRVAPEIGVGGIIDRRKLDARDVLETHHCLRALLHDDVAEFLRVDQPAARANRELKCARLGHRRLVQHPGGDLHVLRLQGARHVAGGEGERLQPVWIEPDAHRIVAPAEGRDRADTGEAAELVGHLGGGVVRDEQRIARLVGRIEVHDQRQVGRVLHRGDADIAHVGRYARLRDCDAVLHLHLRDVEVGAELEGDVDLETAVTGCVRRDVEHVLDAVDALLERRHDRGGDDVRARARVLPAHPHQRRRDVGILREGEPRHRHCADNHEDDRYHGGEDRPVDKEVREAHISPPSSERWRPRCSAGAARPWRPRGRG